jgi:thiamine-phosphate pyrophosphorylase
MSVLKARETLGPGPFIGLSIKTVEQARAAPLGVIDYAGIGGVFATTSKNNTSAPIGPAGLARIVGVFRERIGNFPTCGIAGITAANAEQVIAAGADGVSVISALSRAADPTAAARELRAIVDGALAKYAPRPPAVGAAGHEMGNA